MRACSASVGVVGGERAALAGRDALAPVEAERGDVGEAPGRAALVGRAGRARGILDEPQAVAVGDGPELVVVGGLAEDVDGDDADGARRDRGLDAAGSTLQMSGRMSAKTGVAPAHITEWPVAGNV